MSINAFPASIQAIVQNGILERTFEDSLKPNFVFRLIAERRPVSANMGEKVTYTRTGLLAPVETPLAMGADPTAAEYTIEQYSLTLDQYGNSMDTNMAASAIALASKFLENQKKLGINAAQSLNRIGRNKFFIAYLSGNTWANGPGTAATALVVNDISGFTTKLVNGVQTPVSGAAPLAITIGIVPANVIGYNAGTKTLTLDATKTWADGDAVVAANAPQIVRGGAKASTKAIVAADVVKLSHFMDAVAVLRSNNVPGVDSLGNYAAFIDPTSERQLFADPEFREAFRGTGMSADEWKRLQVATFAGMTWVRNTEQPMVTNAAGVKVHRPSVAGQGALIEGQFEKMADLLAETPQNQLSLINMVDDVALIQRPPLDRLGQILASTWSWIGDFAAPTDGTMDSSVSTTANASQYKRGVIIEHA